MQGDICRGKLGSFKAKQSQQWALEENSKYLHDTSSVRGCWKVIWKGQGKMRAKSERMHMCVCLQPGGGDTGETKKEEQWGTEEGASICSDVWVRWQQASFPVAKTNGRFETFQRCLKWAV